MRSRTRKKSESEFSRRKRRISVMRQPDEKRGSQAAGDHEHVGPEHQPHHATVPGLPGWKTERGVEWYVAGYGARREEPCCPARFCRFRRPGRVWRRLADARRRGARKAGGGDRVACRRGRAPCRRMCPTAGRPRARSPGSMPTRSGRTLETVVAIARARRRRSRPRACSEQMRACAHATPRSCAWTGEAGALEPAAR